MPYFVKIGRENIKIFRFLKMAAVAILDFRNREFLFAVGIWMDQWHHFTEFCQNRSLRCDFSNFQDGHCRHLGFLNSRYFIGYCGPEVRNTSACQILSKSVNQLRRY